MTGPFIVVVLAPLTTAQPCDDLMASVEASARRVWILLRFQTRRPYGSTLAGCFAASQPMSTATVIDVSQPNTSTTFTHAVYFPFFG
jgi:hypothetical protein